MRDDSQALVSVIVPVYNAERFLDQCLASIRAQTYGNLEVICINDGSTDGSLALMERHAAEDPRVRVIDKENGGYGVGCNLGISEARGKWIAIVEPDDYIDPGMYADMLAFSASFDEEIDVIKTPWHDLRDWDDPERLNVMPCLFYGRLKTSKEPFTLAECSELIELHPGIWSALYRRDFLLERGIRFPEYPGAGWADNPFLVETLCQARAIVYLNQPYYRYRTDLPGSTFNHATPELVRRPFDRWLAMTDIIERLGVTDERILESHYMRGFMYVDGAAWDDGEENPIVVEGTRAVFERMDAGIVLRSAKISVPRKRRFCAVRGLDARPHLTPARARYFLHDVRTYVKAYGVAGLSLRVRNRLFGAKRPEEVERKMHQGA